MAGDLKGGAKAMVLGIDGLPFTLTGEYIDADILPGFKRILDSGFTLHQMDASIPDVSSTSWTSFMTGVNPGEHGIYGFMDLEPGTYNMVFPSSGDVAAPTVWDMLAMRVDSKGSSLYERFRGRLDSPLRSVVLNIPQTYPAPEINGILTSGFVCPDLKKGTYPESAYEYLRSIGYISDVDANRAVTDRDGFFKEVFLALEKRKEAFEHFLRNEDWDLFICVITETDRMHHFFFEAARNSDHPCHDTFLSFYRAMDRVVGRLFDSFMEITGGDGLFMTMSDHGFTVSEQEFYVNSWLEEKGYLRLDRERKYFNQIAAGTRAFAMDPARIYINLRDRYQGGEVEGHEREPLVSELKEGLLGIVDHRSRPVIKSVYENKELYRGPRASMGPDLVCIAHDGFDLKASLQKETVFGKGPFTGMHTRHDAHCILPRGVDAGERLHVEHLAGIILEHFAG